MTASSIRRRIATRVGTIVVADQGAGLPLVLWPSLFGDHRLFAHVQRLLGADWRVLRVDGPGFGRSDPPAGEVQADAYAEVVLELLDALDIDQAVVAGCSWGGQVAAHVGVQAPGRVRGIVMMNTPLEPSRGGHVFEVLGTRLLGSTEFWGAGVARAMVSRGSRRAYPGRIREFVAAFPDFDRRAAATTVRTVLTRNPGIEGVLQRLAVPTTILLGAEDRLCPVETSLRARLAPTVTLEILPSCGHLAPLEAPEAVVAALRGLVVEESSAPRRRSAAAAGPAEPVLAPPGAGLPATELLAARCLLALRRWTGSRRSFADRFARERARIRALVGRCDAASGSRRVLIRRLAGLEDSSRYWSVWMTLDHLRIVNGLIATVIGELARGVTPAGAANTATVKPAVDAGPEVVVEFEAACDALAAAASPGRRSRARFPHPWFGPLSAGGWHALAGVHMGIHRAQIERILTGSDERT